MATKKSFQGESEKSIEDAIANAIATDPRSDPGTDIFHYDIADMKVVFGGFVATTTYQVTLERA
jgi:flavin-binding protein dodecin